MSNKNEFPIGNPEDFIRSPSGVSPMERHFDTEAGRRMAMKLATRMTHLGEAVMNLPLSSVIQLGPKCYDLGNGLYLDELDGQKPPASFLLETSTDEIVGINGEVSVLLDYNSELQGYINEVLGVNTPHYLQVSTITDDRVKSREYLESRPNKKDEFYTFYYFSEDGGFKKTSLFPADVPVPFPSLYGLSDFFMKEIESPMLPIDFELAEAALLALKRRLRNVPETSNKF